MLSLFRILLALHKPFLMAMLIFTGLTVTVQASPIFYSFPFASASDTAKIKEIEPAEGKGVWLLDTGGRVSFYDGSHYHKLDAFTPIGKGVSKIELFDGDLWLVLKGQLIQYDIDENQLIPVDLEGEVTALVGTKKQLWVTTSRKTFTIDTDSHQPATVSDRPYDALIAMDDKAVALHENKAYALPSKQLLFEFDEKINSVSKRGDQYWMGTDRGVLVIESGTVLNRYLPELRIDHVAVTHEGVWAGSPSGLFFKQENERDFEALSGQSDDTFSFSGHAIMDIEVGEAEDLWVASDVGLNYRSKIISHINRFPMYVLSPEPGEEQLSSLVEHDDGYLLSTRYKLVMLNAEMMPVKSTKLDTAIDSMVKFDGALWVATALGLKAYNPDTFSRLEGLVPPVLEGVPVDRIISDSHSLWLATGSKIMRFWPQSQTVVDFGSDWSGAFNNRLTSVIDLEESGTWLGTTNGLYFYFDGRFIPKLSREQVGAIKSLKVGPNSELWMLTQRGIYTYDAIQQSLPKEQFINASDDVAKCLVVNGTSALYVTKKGVYRHQFSPNALQFVQGSPNPVASLRHFCQKNAERMLIAGDFGVFSIPEATLTSLFNTPSTPVSPSAVYINGIPWRLGLSSDKPLGINPNGTVAVEVGRMPFGTSETLKYRLEGHGDGNWYSTSDQKLVFSALKPGDYTLMIKLEKGDGTSQQVRLIRFVVASPWYQRLGHFLLVLIIGIIFVAAYYRRKHDAVRVQNKQLRETVHRKVIEIDKREVSVKRFCGALPPEDDDSPEALTTVRSEDLSSESKESEAWRERVIAEINSHFHDPEYSTALLARALFISERSLQRRFKQELGNTFKEMLITTRLENAKRMLCQGDKITDVAVACGFNEPSYFAKSFKQKYGVTPSQFRETCGSEQYP
ncbi:helix-turn-helix domain-containing protein [Grimontia sp. S25]|uniref:Helix-turn-helix domain-containing protein n=2 Tax=Grimontia sedimenti TaxID=2711294 RepID=A0A6M1RJX7_9GAMM|nr:helix-turn-helix domain-containing protein [Grimontia sedimenti]